MTNLFLQANINAGAIKLFLFIVALVILFFSIGGKKRELKNFMNLNIDSESNVSSQKIRFAGYLLMTAGKNLFGSIFFTLILIPFNFFVGITNFNSGPLAFLNLIFAILILVLLFKGYNCIRRAGEVLLN